MIRPIFPSTFTLSPRANCIFFLLFIHNIYRTSYIGIIQAEIESASKILKFLCQEILTKLLVIFVWFGTRFAMANIMPKSNGTRFATAICRKSLQRKHLGRFCSRDFAVSPYAVRVYVKLTG
jgi:hypothetical protein